MHNKIGYRIKIGCRIKIRYGIKDDVFLKLNID